jgi:hypothetical protein
MRLTRKALLALTLGFALTLPAVTTRLYASDEIQYFSWLRSVAFDHDVSFENEYQHFWDAGVAHTADAYESFFVRKNEAGRSPNIAPVGSAILWAPFYAAGHLAALARGAPTDGFSQPYISAVAYGSAAYACLAVALSASIARRVVGAGALASLVILVGTPLSFYAYVAPVFSHACSAFAVSLFLWTWLRVRPSWHTGGVIALGAAAALMTMVREQDVLFIGGPALDLLVTAVRRRASAEGPTPTTTLTRALAGGLAGFVCYLPQLVAYDVLNGHPGPSIVVTRKMSWFAPHALEVLFSPSHGFFAWTPLAALALAGLVLIALGRVRGAAPDARWIGACALVMVASQVYVSGAVESWTVAGGFGQRRFVALTPLLVVGLAALFAAPWWRRPRALRIAAVSVVGLCLWWNLGLMAQFGLHRMDRQRLTLRANAWTTFVDLPREAPALVWRYFTDRASFYGLRLQ